MSCTQANLCIQDAGLSWRRHNARLSRTHDSLFQSTHLHFSSVHASATHKGFPRFNQNASKYKKCTPVCFYGGKGNSEGENSDFSWDSLKEAMEGFKLKNSAENLLKRQTQEWEFYGGGGGGYSPRNGGDASNGPDDENFARVLDEGLQVILATVGFIFVYIYLVKGKELAMIARDYVRYLSGARSSGRLKRAMYWVTFREDVVLRDDWHEMAILATPTWWLPPWWHLLGENHH